MHVVHACRKHCSGRTADLRMHGHMHRPIKSVLYLMHHDGCGCCGSALQGCARVAKDVCSTKQVTVTAELAGLQIAVALSDAYGDL